jgi:hypothetical protein
MSTAGNPGSGTKTMVIVLCANRTGPDLTGYPVRNAPLRTLNMCLKSGKASQKRKKKLVEPIIGTTTGGKRKRAYALDVEPGKPLTGYTVLIAMLST